MYVLSRGYVNFKLELLNLSALIGEIVPTQWILLKVECNNENLAPHLVECKPNKELAWDIAQWSPPISMWEISDVHNNRCQSATSKEKMANVICYEIIQSYGRWKTIGCCPTATFQITWRRDACSLFQTRDFRGAMNDWSCVCYCLGSMWPLVGKDDSWGNYPRAAYLKYPSREWRGKANQKQTNAFQDQLEPIRRKPAWSL